jgi:two-component system chemotaxis response regulator CheY
MKALIVDDSSTMRRIEAAQLAALGYTEIIEAANGQEGLDKLHENMPVDVVLLDVNMPVMDGMTLLKRIRREPQYGGVRIIMVTSESEKGRVLEALRAGATDYVVKPFAPELFKEKLTA